MLRELEYELESLGEWYREAEGPNGAQPPERRTRRPQRSRRRADDPPYFRMIWQELSSRTPRGDHVLASLRNDGLGMYFALLSPQMAAELYQRIRVRRANDDLSRAFNHVLATATRQRLLRILRLRKAGRRVDDAMLEHILWPRSGSREFETDRLYELEEQLYTPNLAAPAWARIRYLQRPNQAAELEAFDPQPPPPGTTLLTSFSFGGATLSSAHRRTIARIAAEIVARLPLTPGLCWVVEIAGHEDEVGDPARFGDLGLQRAVAVTRARLASIDGIRRRRRSPTPSLPDTEFHLSSEGPTRPIRSNVTAAGRALNRRVEIRKQLATCTGFA